MFTVEYRSDCGILCSFVILVFIMIIFLTGGGIGGVQAESISNKEHRTSAAEAKQRELWCYHCNTMDSGERCEKLVDNRTDYHLKCKDEKMCMLWLLERNCSKSCEPGCIVIGERTKLYACTKCCEADFCNAGRSPATAANPSVQSVLLVVSLVCWMTVRAL